MTNIISFPNLGLGPWTINKFLVQIGDFRIAWYGVIITIGIFAAVLLTMRRVKKHETQFTSDDVLDYALWTVLFGILGARIYYVATTWGNYKDFWSLFAIWNGGLAIYGGLIAGAITICVVSKIKKKNPLDLLDAVVPGVMLAQAIGRWGNFFNAEAYGSILKYGFFGTSYETSRFAGQAIPWIMTIKATEDSIPTYAHPTFLYESLWNVIGLVILLLLFRKKPKKFSGQLLLMYLIWYGFGRMFIEGFRTDSLFVGRIRISQLVALGCVIFGILFYVILRRNAKPRLAAEQDSKAYTSLFRERRQEKQPEEEYQSMFVRDIPEPATEPVSEEPVPEEPTTAEPETPAEPESFSAEAEPADAPVSEPEEAEIRAEEPEKEPEASAAEEEQPDERKPD